jgi:uncharacterized membrane protein
VPLTIAASQLGPRLLRTFLRDTGTQVTLGTFIATFIFSLLVLLQLRDDTAALPQLLVTTSLLLALSSLGVLIFFINHVAVSIQAPQVLAAVVAELDADIERSFPPQQLGVALPPQPVPTMPAEPPQIVRAARSGYVQARDDEALLALAVSHDFLLRLRAEPGAFLIAGTPLVEVWQRRPGGIELEGPVNDAYMLGPQRTLVQDIEFGFNELVEVAVRALSPAINDPFTAMSCIDWLGHTLCQLCGRQLPQAYYYDAAGVLRLISAPLTFAQLIDSAFNQIRENGRTSAAITRRLLDTLTRIAGCATSDDQREAVLRHVALVLESSEEGLSEPTARRELADYAHKLAQHIASGHEYKLVEQDR